MRNKFNRTVVVSGEKGFKEYALESINTQSDVEQIIQVKIVKWFEDQYLSQDEVNEEKELLETQSPPEIENKIETPKQIQQEEN